MVIEERLAHAFFQLSWLGGSLQKRTSMVKGDIPKL